MCDRIGALLVWVCLAIAGCVTGPISPPPELSADGGADADGDSIRTSSFSQIGATARVTVEEIGPIVDPQGKSVRFTNF